MNEEFFRFINILNSYKVSLNNNTSFNYDLCLNDHNYILDKEIKNFINERKSQKTSNINNYLSKNQIILMNKNDNTNMTQQGKEQEEKILEIFKYLIIY